MATVKLRRIGWFAVLPFVSLYASFFFAMALKNRCCR
jgi:hypothetical protein